MWVEQSVAADDHCSGLQVPCLDARRRDAIAKREVVLAQELWKVVQEHQKHPECSLHTQRARASEVAHMSRLARVS